MRSSRKPRPGRRSRKRRSSASRRWSSSGASTAQLLDEARAKRDQARGAVDRAREMLARAEAEQTNSAMAASRARDGAPQARARARAARRARGAPREVRGTSSRSCRRWCRRSTSGRASSRSRARRSWRVIDPRDKYVQIYVPVADVERSARRPSRRDRARQSSRAARRRRGELHRRQGELHAGEDRDAQPTAWARSIERRSASWKTSRASNRARKGTSISGDRMEVARRNCVALEKRYGAKRALGPVDLVLEQREIVGIVGPDGAGKTTLLRSIAGLLEVEAAEATRPRPRPARRRHGAQARDRLRAAVVQPPSRSLGHREPALHGSPASPAGGRVRSPRQARCSSRTGLAPFADRLAGALSGGMKQKLAIANALLVAPRLIVLDEPTAGVDVAARSEIWGMLEAEKARALVLISTSYLDEAAACDRLVYLDGGRVLAIGAPAELRARATLELFRVWGEDSKRTSRAARALSYVRASRACAGYARVEVSAEGAPRGGGHPARPRRARRRALCRAHARSTWSRRCSRSRAARSAHEPADHPGERAHQALRRLHRRRRPPSIRSSRDRSSPFSAPTAPARARRSAC